MGAKDSKPTFISYEDAVKRVSDSELRRIREAFKRCAGANGTALSLEAFVHEVLCDGVPYEVAEWLYQACGGTKRGIAFRELLCGIVVLTKGSIEEKIKFLWTLYTNNQGDNGTYIYKRDFARTLHMENTSLPVTGAQRTAEILLGLFGPGEKVTFDQFRSWLLIHKDATVVSKWLLSEVNVAQDMETPTFYQSLAGVTHLEERDIIELEKCFWSLRNAAPTGQLDIESLTPLLSPPLPPAAVAGTFLAFDENRDGHVDFKELCCGLSAACRGPKTERLKFCFKIFDLDSDGVLNNKELIDMVEILCTVANEHLKNQASRASTPDTETHEVDDSPAEKGFDPEVLLLSLKEKLVTVPKGGRKAMFQLGPSGESDDIVVLNEAGPAVLPLEEFLMWSVEGAESAVAPFLQLVFELCHVVLGLRPHCRHHERDIVLGWLRREVERGYSVGQFWYLIAAEWWGAWLAYTGNGSCCRHLRPAAIDEAIVCDESFTTNSSESMGSLMWRCETASLGSAGSSSGVSSHLAAPHPGPVDNSRLREHDTLQVRTLTGEGGHLRRDVTLAQHRDFELVPDALWRALALWYGAGDPLPRQVIRPPNSDVELELYPLQLLLFRHVPSTQRLTSAGMAGGAVAMLGAVPLAGAAPERQLAYTAAFSRLATVRQVCEFVCGALRVPRDAVRLWALGAAPALLEEERHTLHHLRLGDRARLLLELRNPDLTWPEEIGALSSGSRATERRETLAAPNLPGATGLHNLGNTCFMNAALQSVWNTGPLTRYFNSGMHLYEVNTTNPLGTKGALALRYGELCKEVWSMRSRSVAPLRVRWAVSRWCRALAGGGQHDAQELLAWLLDVLHEDLNRAPRPAPPHRLPRDSVGRPDQVVAAEAWAAHSARNASIITELFYGQLKSRVRCDVCSRESVRFDAFNMLSLPLPMESYVRAVVRVILQDGSVPVKYGVRVNSEGTYLDLKKKLSELCGLAPESMLVVELSGATIGRVFEDSAKVASASAGDLYAYEAAGAGTPRCAGAGTPRCAGDGFPGTAGAGAGAAGGAEVSVGGGNTSSLCMPALFCFKRSQPDLLTSHSPPGAFLRARANHDAPDLRHHTLPKEACKADPRGSPTLSVKSLTLQPSSPRPGLAQFGSSPGGMDREPAAPAPADTQGHYIVAVHRKQCRADAYFLPSQRSKPALFGVPILVGLREGMSGRELYAQVWTQVARLLSARPPQGECCNHATDCDDSLGYEFPFTLRLVSGSGAWCGACAWPALCRGCALPTHTAPLVRAGAGHQWERGQADSASAASSPIAQAKLQRQASARSNQHGVEGGPGTLSRLELRCAGAVGGRGRPAMLAIDWDPTALHLRYQSTREKAWREHASLPATSGPAGLAVDLRSCLVAFTGPERLEQPYHCSGCRANQPATKTLQIWRAPPILVIHLKRFQYVNNKWIKSQKVVNFPFQDFDPTEYLASVPQETILRHREMALRRGSDTDSEGESESESGGGGEGGGGSEVGGESTGEPNHCGEEQAKESATDDTTTPGNMERRRRSSIDAKRRARLQSRSLETAPVSDEDLQDFHQHRLLPAADPLDLKYRLYSVISHSGQLSGGHYVSYARHPSGAWLCYNDSSCRELPAAPDRAIDPAAAYLLFYERQGLDYESYLPNIEGKEPVVKDSEALDPDESDLKKMCVIC